MWWAQQLPGPAGTELSLFPRGPWLLSGGWLHSCRTPARLLPTSGNHLSSMALKTDSPMSAQLFSAFLAPVLISHSKAIPVHSIPNRACVKVSSSSCPAPLKYFAKNYLVHLQPDLQQASAPLLCPCLLSFATPPGLVAAPHAYLGRGLKTLLGPSSSMSILPQSTSHHALTGHLPQGAGPGQAVG